MTDPERPGHKIVSVVKPLTAHHPRQARRKLVSTWIDHRWLDWIIGPVVGVGVRYLVLPLIHLDTLEAGIRFSVYASVAAGIFAFIAVAFTPLAIMVALNPGRNLQRLRNFDTGIRRSYLGGTLVMLLCALIIIGCGAADSVHSGNGIAQFVASIALGVAAVKVLRLTQLFAGMLGANSVDYSADSSHRSKSA
ncbi:MAG TPA: hypothetical protein VNV87_05565 [Acidimicrobiales bacterium]|nr:hypothetical protein [Acidimicrobiales bacterium]